MLLKDFDYSKLKNFDAIHCYSVLPFCSLNEQRSLLDNAFNNKVDLFLENCVSDDRDKVLCAYKDFGQKNSEGRKVLTKITFESYNKFVEKKIVGHQIHFDKFVWDYDLICSLNSPQEISIQQFALRILKFKNKILKKFADFSNKSQKYRNLYIVPEYVDLKYLELGANDVYEIITQKLDFSIIKNNSL